MYLTLSQVFRLNAKCDEVISNTDREKKRTNLYRNTSWDHDEFKNAEKTYYLQVFILKRTQFVNKKRIGKKKVGGKCRRRML